VQLAFDMHGNLPDGYILVVSSPGNPGDTDAVKQAAGKKLITVQVEGKSGTDAQKVTDKFSNITIQGLDNPTVPATPQTAVLELWKADPSGNPGTKVKGVNLNVMRLPPRTISLGVYRVQDPALPNGAPAPDSPAANTPDPQAVCDKLNEAFRPAGITFVLTADSGVKTVHYDINGDGFLNSGHAGDSEYDALFHTADLF